MPSSGRRDVRPQEVDENLTRHRALRCLECEVNQQPELLSCSQGHDTFIAMELRGTEKPEVGENHGRFLESYN